MGCRKIGNTKFCSKKRADWWLGFLYSDTGSSWSSAVSLSMNTSDSMQFVRLTKSENMNPDFGDVRFVGSLSSNSLFFEYEQIGSDATYLYYKVAVPFSYTVGSTFYAIWGNPEAVYEGNAQRVALSTALITNNFNRGAKYDVSNVSRGYDLLLDGAGNGSQEANWSCLTQYPVFQTSWGKPTTADWEKIYVGYKYDADDNIHAGSPTSKSALKYSLDFGATAFSSRQFIYDPDANYRSASTSSVAIPTSGATAVSFQVPADRAWQVGDIARVFADNTHYFWITVTSYSGTTLQGTRLSHTGTGTFSSWVISQRFGATNTVITSVKKPDGVIRLVAGFSKIDFYNTEAGGSIIARVYSSYSDLTDGVPGAWSTPVMISDNNWSNVGGKACTTHDGIVWITFHQNAITTSDYASCVSYSRDYGLTWTMLRAVAEGSILLDETDLLPLYDDNLNPINEIRATCRNEDATTSNHQWTYKITWDANTATISGIRENDWYDSTVSRYTSVRCPDKKTVFWAGGDATEKMVYSPDNLKSFHNVPLPTLTTAAISARRVYTTMAVHPDGRMIKVWSSNKQPVGSDLFINYFDWTLNQLYCDTTNTLSDANGTHLRPRDLNPGIRVGEFLLGYRCSSTSSISVPTGAGQQRTLVVNTTTPLAYVAGDLVSVVYTTANTVRFTGTIISNTFDGVGNTATLVVQWLSNTGTGTQASWQINLGVADNTGNLLANQAYLTLPKRIITPQARPTRTTINLASAGTGLVTGGSWGLKKFENRADAVVTITSAGAEGDTIVIKWAKSGTYSGLFGGLGPLAEYTVRNGDTIADVVNGLVASANLKGVSPAISSTGTTLTMLAPFGNNTAINGQSLTVIVTGTVSGNSAAFSGGAAIESSTAVQNLFTIDNANNLARMEQANDNYTEAFTVNDGPLNYVFDVGTTSDTVTDGTTTRSKVQAEGSGLFTWEGQIMFFLTTSPSSTQGVLNAFSMKQEPLDQTPPTEGAFVSGSWSERIDGLGLN